MLNRIVLAVSLALGATALGSALVLAPHAAQAQDQKVEKSKPPKISGKVAKPLKAAQDAMSKNDWDTALAKTLEAKALPELTGEEKYQIEEFLSYIYLKKQDYKNAAAAYDALLASGLLPPDQELERLKVATPLNFQIQNYPKAIEYGQRWIAAEGRPVPDAESLVAQAYYIQDDYPNALKHAQIAIDTARAQGQPVKEAWLQIKLGAQNEADDMVAARRTLAELVQEFPNHKYWEQLLAVTQQAEETDDRVTLNLYRLMLELDALRRDTDYVEMAQLAIEAGVPGDAVKVLDKGFANKVLESEDVQRRRSLLQEAKTAAQADQKSLAGLETEARAAKTGEADVGLGSAYLSYDQYDKAAESLRRGLQKGGVKRPDEAQLLLGAALLKLNQQDEALKAFEAVPDNSKYARVANLWELYAKGPRPVPAAAGES
jgi:outer membrane protein assembly factor BamD (BamD/ComL family)